MDLKPWQVWLFLGWGVVTLVVVALFLAGSVNEGVLLAVMIIGCSAQFMRLVIDRRARNLFLNQDPE